MRLTTRITFYLAILFFLTGCFGKAEPPPIVIGHVSTLSGPGSAAGEHAVRGIGLALEELQRDPPGGAGRPIVVRHTDAHGELEAFASEAVRLVAINRVVALLGGYSPAEVERLEKGEVPILAPTGLRTRAMGSLVFLSGLSPLFQGQALARFAVQDLTAATASVIADERRADASAVADAFIDAFASAGTRAASQPAAARPTLWRFGKSSRLDDVAARVRDSKPALLLFAGDAPDLRAFLARLNLPGLAVLWAGNDVLAGEINQPLYRITAFASEVDTPQTKAFIDQYRKKFREDPDSYAALAYEDVRLLVEVLRQADDNWRPDHLKAKLVALEGVPGLIGPLSMSANQQVRRPALVVRLVNGRWLPMKREEPRP
jgi:branched-chain amino acid transport system substrate-binding protein